MSNEHEKQTPVDEVTQATEAAPAKENAFAKLMASIIGAIKAKPWMFAFIATAVALVAAVVVAIVIGVTSNQGNPDETPEYFEGDEVGVYYYEVADGEILLTLSGGNTFTLAGPSINKTGTYTIDADGKIVLDFIRDEDGTATATINGNDVSLTLGGATMSFTKMVNYTVSFDAKGGSAVSTKVVLNGQTLAKPADPTKEGSVFLGWYSDEALTTPFDFASSTITADTTLYARWVQDQVGVGKYVIDFDLGYEGAEDYDAITTIAGLAYGVPTPERTGYTFGGWWISMYEDGEKLTYAYTEDTVFNADTTLYALWYDNAATKLAAPKVSVNGNTISWSAVSGAMSYAVVIKDASGTELYNQSVGTTTVNYDFASGAAGDYTVSVVAVSTNTANSSHPAIRYYANKALTKVSQFQVIDGILIYNAVDGATSYIVTVDCGNDAHDHTSFNNGASTSFSLMNCPMQVGGIKITVTAKANGFASSTSETYVYERSLNAIPSVVYNAATDTFVWNAVAGASSYIVTVTVGDDTYTFNNGTKTSFSVAGYTGEISVSVTPANSGFNSPAATTATCTKVAPAAPTGLTVSGMTISWNAAVGAESYEIKIGSLTRTTTATSFDLSQEDTLEIGASYAISVKSVKGAESSAYTKPVTIGYRVMNPTLTYQNNTISWVPVIGITNYQIRINGDTANVINVSGKTSEKITLTKAGVNTIEVRYTEFGGSTWASIDVVAYAVKYMPRNGASEITEYLATGDSMTLPRTYTYTGYNFTDWYTSPDGAVGNGKAYPAGSVFTSHGSITLYADWDPVTYKVVIQTQGYDITNLPVNPVDPTELEFPATYTKNYRLPVPNSSNPQFTNFVGWFTGPAGSGNQLTDGEGNSVTPYPFTRDTIAYPFYDTGLLTFTLKSDGTYSVSRGPNFDTVSSITIPSMYNGIPVTTIVENAFASRTNLVTISIPNSIQLVGTGAFSGCTALTSINVYEVEGNHDVYYASDDGALVRYDMGTTYLELVPRAKTGTYTMSDDIQVIRDKAFQYAKVSKVIIGTGVTSIAKYAFYSCSALESVEFKEDRTLAVAIDSYAFYLCSGVTSIKFPATLNLDSDTVTTMLKRLTKLATIDVEEGGTTYSTVNGMLTNATKTTIVYSPVTISGSFTVPQGIQEIAPNAFKNCVGITDITIPAYVRVIGDNAFDGCAGVKSVTFSGSRNNDLTIGAYAFANIDKLEEVTFKGNTDGIDEGATTIGAYAFVPDAEMAVEDLRFDVLTFEAGANIKLIGNHAFAGQKALMTINFTEGAKIEKIGNYAFYQNSALRQITIPDTTTEVGDYAFAGCSNVSTVTILEGASEINFGDYAFQDCSGLTKITLPSTVRDFDGLTFDGCNNIEKIEVSPDNPTLWADEDGILYKDNKTVLLFYPKALIRENSGVVDNILTSVTTISGSVFSNNTDLKEIKINKEITEIGDRVFYKCTNLAKVNFETGGTALKIGDYAFSGCTALRYGTTDTTVFELPSYTTSIGAYAFESCKFTSFTIPDGVTSIKAGAFYKNTSLVSISIPLNVSSIGDKAFAECSALTTFTVERPEAGETASNLSLGTLAYLPDASGNYYTNGVFYNCKKLNSVDLGDRVTLIGAYAFYGLKNTGNFTTITLSSVLTDIGGYAFYDTKITAIEIPKSVKTIYEYAFARSAAKAGTITANGLTFEQGGTEPLQIGVYAFRYQHKIESITFPERIDLLYTESVVVGNISYKDIANRFEGMLALASINIANDHPNNESVPKFTSIDGVLYETDANGTAVTLLYCPIANTGKDGSFVITVPKTVTLVENGAFYNVTKLTTIKFEEYDKNDENYGKQLLSLGTGTYSSASFSSYVKYSVIGGVDTNSITRVELPSHLGYLGSGSISTTYSAAIPGDQPLTLIFNPDSNNIELADNALYGCNATSISIPHIAKAGNYAFRKCNMATSITFTADDTWTTIPNSMFSECSSLTSVAIPKSVTVIGYAAFEKCTALETVTFENGSLLEIIEGYAFTGCTALSSINIGDCKELQSIGDLSYGYVFQNCTSLTGLDLSGCTKLTTIANGAFSGCSSFASFSFPENVQTIGSNIFRNCSALTEVTLSKTFSPAMLNPNSGSYTYTTFLGCTNLETVNVPAENPYFSTDTFGVLYDPQKTIVYLFPAGADATGYTIPSTVREISQYAFAFYPGAAITLPSGLETIGHYAFYHSALTSITIPASVTTIGDYAFAATAESDYKDEEGNLLYPSKLETVIFESGSVLEHIGAHGFSYARKLVSINLPDNLKTIDAYTFEYCQSLKEVILPAALEAISTRTFQYCDALTRVVMQEGLTSIGTYAFYSAGDASADDLTITIPSTVTTIASQAFYMVPNLTAVTFTEGSVLESIGGSAFYNTAVTRFVFPETLTTLGSAVFHYIDELEYVEFRGTNLTEIPAYTFAGASKLETVILPEGLLTIGKRAFTGDETVNGLSLAPTGDLTSLKSITIPASVTSIGEAAFEGCTALESVIFESGSALKSLGDGTSAATNTFKDTTSLKTVVLPEGLEVIGGHAFENSSVANIELPATLTSIGDYAFYNCDNITEVDIFGNISYLGDYAFYDCDKLTRATPSFGLEYFGGLAFGYCEQLAEAYIPATVTMIGANPYIGCSGVAGFTLDPDNAFYFVDDDGALYDISGTTLLYYPASITTENVVISPNVQKISAGAFAGAAMKTITIPARLGKIEANLFQNCPNLTTVIIEEGITEIGDYAFDGCAKLNNVVLPSSVSTIGNYAFSNCTSLSSFTFAEKAESDPYVIGTHMFDGCTSMTEVILPQYWTITAADSTESGASTKTANVPSYMFANTGIVHAVLPERVTDLRTSGVFMNCKNLESISFEAETMKYTVGSYFFYGCSKIREIELPFNTEKAEAILQSNKGYGFAYCTSLERVTVYQGVWDGMFPMNAGVPSYDFVGCTNLKEVNIYVAQPIVNQITDKTEYRIAAEAYISEVGMFSGCTSLEKYYFSEKCTVKSLMFEDCVGLTSLVLMPASIQAGAFKGCVNIDNAYLYPYKTTNTTLSKFAKGIFDGWTSDQSIYIMTMTREEFEAILELNTAADAPTYEEIFEGCDANVYFLDDILAMDTLTVGGILSNIPANLFTDCNATTIEIHEFLNGAVLANGCFSGMTAEQSIYFMSYGYDELYKYISTGIFTDCAAKIYDKDGSLLSYNSDTGVVTVTNASSEVIALWSYTANTADALAALGIAALDKLELVYFGNLMFGDIAALQDGAAAFAAFTGYAGAIYDKDGNAITVDAATGLIKTVTIHSRYVEEKAGSGGGFVKLGKSYVSTIKGYDFTKLGAGVTVYIDGNATYADILSFESKTFFYRNMFAGCEATIYDAEGNKLIVDAEGWIVTIIAPDGTTLIYDSTAE